jgi:hypothetical protein
MRLEQYTFHQVQLEHELRLAQAARNRVVARARPPRSRRQAPRRERRFFLLRPFRGRPSEA